ncbi:Chaperone protein dnaJ 8 [Hirschfeldia incana]|nr:Chaperone protein dnaJ 8 [Hirschfeldia incana]
MTIALTIGGNGFSGLSGSSFSSSSSSCRLKNTRRKNTKMLNRTRVVCSSSSVMDPYKTLQIRPDSSEYEVKQAFRQLAKKYHPDVCRGSNCGVQFQTINEAYDIVLKQIKNQMEGTEEFEPFDVYEDGFNGMNDPDCDTWEEWMGWEGAGTRDYSSHVNPYA